MWEKAQKATRRIFHQYKKTNKGRVDMGEKCVATLLRGWMAGCVCGFFLFATQPQNRRATRIAMPPQTQRATQPPSKVATLLIKQLTNHTGSHIGMPGSQTSVATKPKDTRQPLDRSASAQPHSQPPAVQPASRQGPSQPPGSCSQAATEPARHLTSNSQPQIS